MYLCIVLKHTSMLFSLSDHHILSREWRVIVDQEQANYYGWPIYDAFIDYLVNLCCYNQSGVTELLIMRDPHYGRVCFKSVKTLGDLHS